MTRILFLPEIRGPVTSERAPALYHLLRRRHDVVPVPAPLDRFLYDTSKAKWPRYLLYPLDKLLLGLLGLARARRARAEVVFCETAHHALVGLAIARILGLRCIWDSHGNVKLFAESMGKGRVFSRLASLLEGFVGKRVDALVTVAQQDVEAYVEMGVPRSKAHIVPTCIDLQAVDRDAPPRAGGWEGMEEALPALLFFGNFAYAPNLEALRYINETLAPALEGEGVRCEIQIAGRDIPSLPFHPSIRTLGFVPNLHAHIQSVDLCVVPLWRGQGVHGAVLTKVLDVMAVGTPVVLSAFAARGLPGVEDGVNAWVAPSDAAFPETVARALTDPERSRTLGRRGRELIERAYDWEAQMPRIDAILRGGEAGGEGAP